jgi:hypothetical protein
LVELIGFVAGTLAHPWRTQRVLAARCPWRAALLVNALSALATPAVLVLLGLDPYPSEEPSGPVPLLLDSRPLDAAWQGIRDTAPLVRALASAALTPLLLLGWTATVFVANRLVGAGASFSALLATQGFARTPLLVVQPLLLAVVVWLGQAGVEQDPRIVDLVSTTWVVWLTVVGVVACTGCSARRATGVLALAVAANLVPLLLVGATVGVPLLWAVVGGATWRLLRGERTELGEESGGPVT